MVWTAEPSLAHGGHFFSWSTLPRTLEWRWVDHTFGTHFTNTDGSAAELWIHAMFVSQYIQILNLLGQKADAEADLPQTIQPVELAALMCMVAEPEQFASAVDKKKEVSAREKMERMELARALKRPRICNFGNVLDLVKRLKTFAVSDERKIPSTFYHETIRSCFEFQRLVRDTNAEYEAWAEEQRREEERQAKERKEQKQREEMEE